MSSSEQTQIHQLHRGREVSCRPLGFFFEQLAKEGVDKEQLCEGIDRASDLLRGRNERVDWETFRQLLANVGRHWDDERLVEAGRRLSVSRWVWPWGLVGRLLFSCSELYRWNFDERNGVSRQSFTCVVNRMRELAPGHLEVDSWMEPGYAPSRELAFICQGALQAMPGLLSLRPAEVSLTLGADNSMHFIIDHPVAGGLLSGLRRAVSRPFTVRAMARELKDTQEVMFRRYGELEWASSGRDHAEQALRESDERFRVAFQAAPMVMLISSLVDNRFIDVNERFLTTSGYARDEIVGRDARAFKFWKDAEQRAEAYGRLLAGEAVRGLEAEFLDRDGRSWTGLVSAERITLSGEPCIIWQSSDISARKRAEEERRRLEESMLQTQKLESLGVLAGGIAHDFNNLLVGMLGNSQLALQKLPTGSQLRPRLEAIESAATRAAELTREMLAYAGRARMQRAPMNLSTVVREIAVLIESSAPKAARFTYTMPSTPIIVEGDATQIRQVVMNFFTNAIEALGDSGGAVEVKTSVVEVDRELLDGFLLQEELEAGTFASFEVVDDGCGMDEDTVKRIFDPFFTTKFTGRGLGLAATLGIIRGHGGTLSVESTLGGGTRFQVLLPLRSEPLELEREALRPTVAREVEPRTALIVDDEPAVVQVTERILGAQGYRTLCALSGAEALAILRRDPAAIDIVVLDLEMPEMDGTETFAALRAVREDVPVLCCSGHGELDLERWVEGRPRTSFMTKPFTVEQLTRRVAEAVGSNQQPVE